MPEEQKLLPTPPKGAIVLFYAKGQQGNPDAARPALVIEQECPGRVTLKVITQSTTTDELRKGVHWTNDPSLSANDPKMQWGTWSYTEDDEVRYGGLPPPHHMNLHRRFLERRAANQEAARKAAETKADATKKKAS